MLRATVALDGRELWTAGAVALAAGAVLPLLPGEAGLPCPLRTVTGVPCPLCGMTTSVEAAVHLHPAEAFAANPGGLLLVAAARASASAPGACGAARRSRTTSVPATMSPSRWFFRVRRIEVIPTR